MPDVTPLVKLSRLEFRPESAADAWQRIFAFFGEYLRPPGEDA